MHCVLQSSGSNHQAYIFEALRFSELKFRNGIDLADLIRDLERKAESAYIF